MIDNLKLSSSSLLSKSLIQNEEVDEVESSDLLEEVDERKNSFVDESQISNEAMALYKKEQEISNFKDLVMEQLNSDEGDDLLVGMIQNNEYSLESEDLADSLMQDASLVNYLS